MTLLLLPHKKFNIKFVQHYKGAITIEATRLFGVSQIL